jgi:hypothetical protein
LAIHDAGQRKVAVPKETQEKETGRIVMFPTRISLARIARRNNADLQEAESEVEDLRKYERDSEPDDYGRRMVINVIAFAFIVVLTLAGIWLADQMALLRKHQDCALSGRKNCADLGPAIRDTINQNR